MLMILFVAKVSLIWLVYIQVKFMMLITYILSAAYGFTGRIKFVKQTEYHYHDTFIWIMLVMYYRRQITSEIPGYPQNCCLIINHTQYAIDETHECGCP